MMFWEFRKHRQNGAMSEIAAATVDLLPTDIDALLEGIQKQAWEDGQSGLPAGDGKKAIAAMVRLNLSQKIGECRARFRFLQEKIKEDTERLSTIWETADSLRERVEQNKEACLIRGMLYTLTGAFFVVGDIALAYDLLIRTWGLGNANRFHTWSLVVALGLTPIIAELVYSRFIESKFDPESKIQPRIVRWFFIIIAPFLLFSFGYFGFLRGIIMTYLQKYGGGDIYGPLLAAHPYLNVVAFVLMAILFIVGGAVLLTVGLNELGRCRCCHMNRKALQNLLQKGEYLQSEMDKMKEEMVHLSVQLETVQQDQDFEKLAQSQIAYYEGKYMAAYKRSLKQALTSPGSGMSLDGEFHRFGQAAMDQVAVNDAMQLFMREENSNGR